MKTHRGVPRSRVHARARTPQADTGRRPGRGHATGRGFRAIWVIILVALAAGMTWPDPARADTTNPFAVVVPYATVATIGVGGLALMLGNIGDAISDDPGETGWRTWGWIFATANLLAAAGSYLLAAGADYDQGYGLAAGTIHVVVGGLDILTVLTNRPEDRAAAGVRLTPGLILDPAGRGVVGLAVVIGS